MNTKRNVFMVACAAFGASMTLFANPVKATTPCIFDEGFDTANAKTYANDGLWSVDTGWRYSNGWVLNQSFVEPAFQTMNELDINSYTNSTYGAFLLSAGNPFPTASTQSWTLDAHMQLLPGNPSSGAGLEVKNWPGLGGSTPVNNPFGYTNYLIIWDDNLGLRYQLYGATGWTYLTSNPNVNVNGWNAYRLEYNAPTNQYSFYINGALINTVTGPSGTVPNAMWLGDPAETTGICPFTVVKYNEIKVTKTN